MALKIPIYDAPQVKQQAAPNVGLNLQVPNLGAPLAEGLNQVASVYQRETQKLDALRIEDARNKLAVQSEIAKNSIAAKKGEAALKPIDGESPYLNEENLYKDSVATIRKDLTPRQAAEFDRIAAGEFTRLGVYTEAHRNNELQRYEKGVLEGSVLRTKNDLDVAIATANKDIVAEATKNYQQALAALQPGIPTEQAQVAAVSKVMLNSVAGIVKRGGEVGGVDGPNAYLYERMTKEDRDEAIYIASQGDVANKALDIVSKTYTPEMTHAEAVKLAETQAGGNAKLYDQLMSRYNSRIATTAADMQKVEGEMKGDAQVRVQANPGSIGRLIAEVNARTDVSKEARGNLVTWLNSYQKSLNAEYKANNAENFFPQFAALVTSPAFPTMTRDEVMAAIPNFGSYGGQILNRWEQATAAGAQVNVPETVKEAVAKDLGLNLKNKTHEATINKAVISAHDSMSSESTGKGKYASKKPTWADMYQEVKLRATPFKVEEGFFGGSKAALADMTPDQLNSAIKLIPQNDMKMVDKLLSITGTSSRTPADIFKAKAEIDALKTGNEAAYIALWNRTFPKQPAR